MADMNKIIQKFITQEIALSKKDISESAKSREWFLDKIKKKIDEGKNEPTLYKEKPFVNFGSYFKGTKVADVDEYDVLVVIDSNTGQFTQGDEKTGEGLGDINPNHKYDDKYKKEDKSGVSPSKMLNWLKGVVKEVAESFGGTVPERAGQAVTARIESKDINIDLVPAGKFKHTKRSGIFFYDIPRGDKNNGWILTDPEQDIKLINELAQKKSDFKNVIRILKYIKNKYNFLVPSFAIECCVIEYANGNEWTGSVFKDLQGALGYFAQALGNKEIKDTFDSKNNLLSGVENIGWYKERVENISKILNDQVSEDDEEKAYARIKKVLSNE
jgi:hypothetical protein